MDDKMNSQTGKDEPRENAPSARRDFLNDIVAGAFGIAAVGASVVTYQYLLPNALFEPPMSFRAGTPGLYPLNSVTYIEDQEVYIVHKPEGFYAVSAICTHLGCITQWKPALNLIACPCHGSEFKADGTKVRGPAPISLFHWAITLNANNELFVDKTKTIPYGDALKA